MPARTFRVRHIGCKGAHYFNNVRLTMSMGQMIVVRHYEHVWVAAASVNRRIPTQLRIWLILKLAL